MFTSKAFKGLFQTKDPFANLVSDFSSHGANHYGARVRSDHLGGYSKVLSELEDTVPEISPHLRSSNNFNASTVGIDTPIPSSVTRGFEADTSSIAKVFQFEERYGSVLEMTESDLAVRYRLEQVAETLEPLAEAEGAAVVAAESAAAAETGALAAALPVLAGVAGVLLLVAGGYALYKHFNVDAAPESPTSVNQPLEPGPSPGFQRLDDRSGGWEHVHPAITQQWRLFQKY